MNSRHLDPTINTLSTALDAASFALLHGNRQQQIESGNAARALLSTMGYAIRQSQTREFTIKARFSGIPGTYIWSGGGLNSIDALAKALEQVESRPPFAGKSISITVTPEPSTTGYRND